SREMDFRAVALNRRLRNVLDPDRVLIVIRFRGDQHTARSIGDHDDVESIGARRLDTTDTCGPSLTQFLVLMRVSNRVAVGIMHSSRNMGAGEKEVIIQSVLVVRAVLHAIDLVLTDQELLEASVRLHIHEIYMLFQGRVELILLLQTGRTGAQHSSTSEG